MTFKQKMILMNILTTVGGTIFGAAVSIFTYYTRISLTGNDKESEVPESILVIGPVAGFIGGAVIGASLIKPCMNRYRKLHIQENVNKLNNTGELNEPKDNNKTIEDIEKGTEAKSNSINL